MQSSGKGGSGEKWAGPKDKKKRCVSELVQEAPVASLLARVRVPLHGLLTAEPTLSLQCDLSLLPSSTAPRPPGPAGKVGVWEEREEGVDGTALLLWEEREEGVDGRPASCWLTVCSAVSNLPSPQ